MTGPVSRNSVVSLLGTPHRVEGSLNDPVEREENGIHYNEKWSYHDLADDPAGTPDRIIYWHRYDFIATLVRTGESAPWQPDTRLIEVAKETTSRLATVDDSHSAYAQTDRYHAASLPQDFRDLGGYMQNHANGQRIGKNSGPGQKS